MVQSVIRIRNAELKSSLPCGHIEVYKFVYIYGTASEKAMATHSSTLAWKIPWTEEPGRLQSMGSLRVGHDWVIHFHFSLSCIGEGNGNPLQCSCLENPRDEGAWWAAVYGVAQSRTWLKRLSSSSSSNRLYSSSSLSALRVVSSAYLRLLIFLPAILIPACASSSPAFLMMYSACKLNKQTS